MRARVSVCEGSGAPPVLQQKERKDAIVVRTGSIISAARGGRLCVSVLLHFVVAGLLFLRFRPLKTRDRHSTIQWGDNLCPLQSRAPQTTGLPPHSRSQQEILFGLRVGLGFRCYSKVLVRRKAFVREEF